jgi:hypothetical protein
MPDPSLTPAPATPIPAPQPVPPVTTLGAASALAALKLYAASAVGAFLLGLTDYVRHGTDSTVVALNNGLAALDPRIDLLLVILLMTPVMGLIAAWIFQPTTERDAFALGFAVFSLFALVPEQPQQAAVEELSVSPEAEDVSLRLIVPAFAGEVLAEGGSALLLLAYEGEPPPSTKVSVRNLTKGQWLGTYNVLNSLQLVGAPGDRVQLAIEARGYERTRIELTLQEAAESYTVRLQENRTPLFLQRLTPAAKAMALPSRGAVRGTHATGAVSTTGVAAPVQ